MFASRYRYMTCAVAVVVAGLVVPAAGLSGLSEAGLERFHAMHPQSGVTVVGDRVVQVYGPGLAEADDAVSAADLFVANHADVFGVRPEGLSRSRVLEVMGGRFVAVRYEQVHRGVPVMNGWVTVLVLQDRASVVLANSGAREVPADLAVEPAVTGEQVLAAMRKAHAHLTEWSEPELVIWAEGEAARLAWRLVGRTSQREAYESWLFVVDALSGELLARYDGVVHVDVVGNVSGFRTPGLKPDRPDNPPVQTPIERALVRNLDNGRTALTDANGDYVLSNDGSGPVDVRVDMFGQAVQVDDTQGPEEVITQTVTPPGPADFVYNQAQMERLTADVNALYHIEQINKMYLEINPDYPIADRRFAHTNIASTCNAFYDIFGDQSTNYFRKQSDTGCPNTAYSTVIYHEYGHHIVHRGHPGAWPAYADYHEGNADISANLTTDDPCVADDFFGPGRGCLRNSETSDLQYPCNGGSHTCGQVIAGAVWDTLLAMKRDFPGQEQAKLEHLRALWLNSILLEPPGIQPGLTVDYLTLDDCDGNIFNGTPHYLQIAEGFGNHNLDAPELNQIPGDFDADGDVDVADFGVFTACFSGAGNPVPPGCEAADFDCDGDVDIEDFAVFAANFTGS